MSGPSFLGLSDDPNRNLSYLLEDDEPRQGRTRSLIALILILLLAAVVWIVHSKRAEDGKRERASQLPQSPAASAPSPDSATTNPLVVPAAGEKPIPEASPASSAPAPAAEAGTETKSTEVTPAPPAAASPQPANSESGEGTQPAAPPEAAPPSGPAPSSSSPTSSASSPSSSSSTTSSSASTPPPTPTSPATVAKPSAQGSNLKAARSETKAAKRATRQAARSSAHAPAEAGADADHENADHESQDPLLVQGQKYLYGQGVPQSCSLAEKNLRMSAQTSNPEAQSVLGAMYATGHCVARDLPAAYRWFARASHLEPNNQRIEKDLEVLWRQMTAEEKAVAIRSH